MKDGGSAFPASGLPGMSLRDFFAAAYIIGRAVRERGIVDYDDAAESSYALADAMLKAREAQSEP